MQVKVKNYMYRWFDTMLIVQTENDDVLYLYCPSECLYDDGSTRFYCYSTNMNKNDHLTIDYVRYSNNNSCIKCDGVAEFIKYSETENPRYTYRHTGHEIPNDILRKAGGYWRYLNDREEIEKDVTRRQWSGMAAAFSDMLK